MSSPLVVFLFFVALCILGSTLDMLKAGPGPFICVCEVRHKRISSRDRQPSVLLHCDDCG